MNDQELARQIVAHLGGDGPNNYAAYSIVIDGIAHWMPAEKFVRDWCVAGAMMEKQGNGIEYALIVDKWEASYTYEESSFKQNIIVLNESLPRALNEACAEAHRS